MVQSSNIINFGTRFQQPLASTTNDNWTGNREMSM